MENFYEEVYQYLIERGIEDDEATEVVNHLYEANVHEYGLLTENRGKAILNMLKAVGMMSGILKKPGAKQAVKQVKPKVKQGTPLQGNLLTKKGTAQNFTGGRTPFTGTDPVPAASSALPQPVKPPRTSPGQMQIPGTSNRAQDLRNVTRNPNLGLPGNTSGFGGTSPLPAPKPPIPDSLSKSIQNLGRDVKPPVSKVDRVVNTVRRSALPVGATAGTGLALTRGEKPKAEDPRRPDGSIPPYTPPRPPADPEPKVKPEPPKEEPVQRPAAKLSAAAKDFDRTFAAKRAAGEKEFTWRGKKYTTKLKGE